MSIKNLEPFSAYIIIEATTEINIGEPQDQSLDLFSAYTLPRELVQSPSYKYCVLTLDSQILSPPQISPLYTQSMYPTACSVLSLDVL